MTATEIARGVWRIEDTCHVYLLADPEAPEGERDAVAIDFGSGLVLGELAALGIRRVTDVLMTHHHRDQGQGLPLAVEHGARIHVPPVERELFDRVEEMWEGRPLDNDYNLRQDRFSLLASVPVHAAVPEYREIDIAGVRLRVIPTPGHTIGSVTYLLERDGDVLAFSGDLIYAPGKVWSLAATQWSYTQTEGPAMTVLSARMLAREGATRLAPSHGAVMDDAGAALDLLADTMQEYVDSRRSYPWDLLARLDDPFVALSEHLLLNRTSMSCSYIVLSETGEALVIDYGYDMTTGLVPGQERAARRPWLASLPALRRNHGVTTITVALPTHYHDDHIAGMPLLRDVEGTELWIPENVAPTMADPWREDLPCQWYDPITADRVLPLDEPFTWNEYTFTAHEQPGHTLYAVAYSLEIDGSTVVFTGDQQEGLGGRDGRRDIMNYQYRNLFRLGDYSRSAALYRRIAPGLMASGHWEPRSVDDEYLDYLAQSGRMVDDLHQRLLPLDDVGIGPDGQAARLLPYRGVGVVDEPMAYEVRLRNPRGERAAARVSLVLPVGWRSSQSEIDVELGPHEEASVQLTVTPTSPGRRHRLALDVTIGSLRLGQHTEALIDVTASGSAEPRP
jgi:glyoxylase-like metal-dependent hydrolase (beta-lactamase superfamily II)